MKIKSFNISIFLQSLALLLVGSIALAEDGHADEVDFNSQIKPLLSDRCYVCHGPDSNSRESGLRLDIEAEAAQAFEPGDPDNSDLIERIFSDDDSDIMPPPDSNLALSDAEKELLRKWIEQGAKWEKHWAFVKPKKTAPPNEGSDWSKDPIDRFVFRGMKKENLAPSEPAAKERLIRRVTFDLTGLPPTLEEVDAFLNDESDGAYEKVIDRLLASPRFGERMATDWLDAARYSDTYGYQVDRNRRVWPYRDWVIKAFNENKTYDQFVTEQLAGDLLPNATDEQILATAFNRLHPQKVEGGSVPEEFRVEYVADRTQTFSTAMLGMTMECARCHDHKYDPFSIKEYYQLYSYFNNIDEAGLYSFFTNSVPSPVLMLSDDKAKAKLKDLETKAKGIEKDLQSLKQAAEVSSAYQKWLDDNDHPKGEEPIDLVKRVDFEKINVGNNERYETDSGKFAVRLTGDDEVKLDFGNFRRYQPFSICVDLKTPDRKERAVVLHRSRAWTDAGSRGYELMIEEGKLAFALIHFWPGNAIGIRTRNEIPVDKWLNAVVTYDGSSQAKGISLYVDGVLQEVDIIRNDLQKQIAGGGGDNIALGARFRDRGFTGGSLSGLSVFSRELVPWEVSNLLEANPEAEVKAEPASFDFFLGSNHEPWRKKISALSDVRKQVCNHQDGIAEIMVMKEMPSPRNAYVLMRGAYDQHGEKVSANTPEIFPPMPSGVPQNRLGLANWLTQPHHPLTARVAVNRFWQLMFGEGLVRTPEDFGRQGALPTHPELLDWLAVDFVENDWDVKRLLKQLALSKTYRQASRVTARHLEVDPENKWLARFPSYRLPAEMIRDNALAVSGNLVDTIGGAPVRPYEVAESFKPAKPDQGEGLYRRSLYTYWQRTAPAPVMMAFDAAKRDVCRVKRERTSSPLQALALLNGPQFVEAARGLAETVLLQQKNGAGAKELEPDKAIQTIFRKLTSRHPTKEETQILLKLLDQQTALFSTDDEAVKKFLDVGFTKRDPALEAPVLAAWTSLTSMLMNFDEAVTKR